MQSDFLWWIEGGALLKVALQVRENKWEREQVRVGERESWDEFCPGAGARCWLWQWQAGERLLGSQLIVELLCNTKKAAYYLSQEVAASSCRKCELTQRSDWAVDGPADVPDWAATILRPICCGAFSPRKCDQTRARDSDNGGGGGSVIAPLTPFHSLGNRIYLNCISVLEVGRRRERDLNPFN